MEDSYRELRVYEFGESLGFLGKTLEFGERYRTVTRTTILGNSLEERQGLSDLNWTGNADEGLIAAGGGGGGGGGGVIRKLFLKV